MDAIHETARNTRVIAEADICVLGGSATGVFAAVRAARLGARVVLVEKQNCFGGVATSGLVNIWHSLFDTEFKRQIIAGLTLETIERLRKRGAVDTTENDVDAFRLNTEELKIELDELVTEAKVKPYLHTFYVAPHVEAGRLAAVIVENKSGRGAIRAKYFIDATGDGDLCTHLGIPHVLPPHRQPSTTCAKLYGFHTLRGFDLNRAILDHKDEFGIPDPAGWRTYIPGIPEVSFHAETKAYGANCADADELTAAEIEGRRQVRAIMDIVRKYGPPGSKIALVALSSYIGIRETRHIRCSYRLTEEDVLTGRRFEDAIANGTYRVDIHHDDKPGITFRYLDGRELYFGTGHRQEGRWRPETPENPTFYQIPFRSMVPQGWNNLIVAGRAIDADRGAFGAIRVMVNTNQTGEAAGVAAYLALASGKSVAELDPAELRRLLAAGGSVVL